MEKNTLILNENLARLSKCAEEYGLNAKQEMILSYVLKAFAEQGWPKTCGISVKTLAQTCEVSNDTIIRHRNMLVEKGLIDVEVGSACKPSRYTLNPDIFTYDVGDAENVDEQPEDETLSPAVPEADFTHDTGDAEDTDEQPEDEASLPATPEISALILRKNLSRLSRCAEEYGLSANQEMILSHVLEIFAEQGWPETCGISVRTLVQTCEMSDKTIIQHRNMLVEKGLIDVEVGSAGKPSRYTLNPDIFICDAGDAEDTEQLENDALSPANPQISALLLRENLARLSKYAEEYDLHATQKIILSHILEIFAEQGWPETCGITIETLVQTREAAKVAIIRHRNILVEKGLIDVEVGSAYKPSRYTLNPDIFTRDAGDIADADAQLGPGTHYPTKMRFMTIDEWNRLVELTGGNDSRIHWADMFSLTAAQTGSGVRNQCRALGYASCNYKQMLQYAAKSDRIGFRPVIDVPESDIKEGETTIIGTLYMGDTPVLVPEQPTCKGDVARLVPGAMLEMRQALEDPAYQVTGFRVGNAMIADRCLIRGCSVKTLIGAGILWVPQNKANEQEDELEDERENERESEQANEQVIEQVSKQENEQENEQEKLVKGLDREEMARAILRAAAKLTEATRRAEEAERRAAEAESKAKAVQASLARILESLTAGCA